jgi:hypothetical protein
MAKSNGRTDQGREKSAAHGVIDAFLKLCLAFGVLMAGGGIGYYFGVFRPQQELKDERQSQETAKAQRAAAARAELAERQRRAAAQTRLADCRSDAELAYRSRWSQACRSQSASDRAQLEDCLGGFFASEESCARKHPVRPERDCELAPDLAASLGEDRNRRIDQCYAEFGQG